MKSWNDLTEDQKYSLMQYGISDEAGYNEISNLVNYSPELKAALEGEGSFDWNLIDKAKEAKNAQDEADYNAEAQKAREEAEAQAKAAYEQAKAQQEAELQKQIDDEYNSFIESYVKPSSLTKFQNWKYESLKRSAGLDNVAAYYLAKNSKAHADSWTDYKWDWNIDDYNNWVKQTKSDIENRLRTNQAEIPVSEVTGWWDNPYQAAEETNVDKTISKTDTSNTVPTAANEDYSGRENYVEIQDAIAEGAQEAQQNAEDQARSSASAGINKSRAGMLSENNSQQSQTNNVSNIYGANTSQNASTQADYLQKMAQADALDQQAANMRKGAGLTALGNGISGAMSGAATGATLGMSDERAKEAPNNENNLQDMIKQFRSLYKRLQELKGGK